MSTPFTTSTEPTTTPTPDDPFSAWLGRPPARPRIRGRRRRERAGELRFAFAGRISTNGYQDPVSSRQWQYDNADRLITGHGLIVVEFFDGGYSRSLPWHLRPQAAALLAEASRPDRRFDAVVIGEFERAFAGRQALQIIPYLQSHGVQVWLPEADGPIDLANPTHHALIMMLGHQSEREVLRSRARTTTAMCTQAREQGRHLGGRPPYGYRLVDAGPHPNQVHAGWGRRLHRLEPDPVTAPQVRWMFTQRLTGASTAGIARMLNDRGIASPSQYDPDRNPHRTGTGWTLRTVAAILANPRYTGRQVWNRQRTDHHETVPGDKHTSQGPTRAWNPKSDWAISHQPAHPALVSDTDFLAAQQITALATPADPSGRRYRLTGLLLCATCGRRMEGHWVHGRAGYRCRHGHTSARPPGDQPRWVYWPEQRLVTEVLQQLTTCGVLEPAATTDDLTGHLRHRNALIICADAALTIDDPTEATNPPTTPDTGAHEHAADACEVARDVTDIETTRGSPAANATPAAPGTAHRHPAAAATLHNLVAGPVSRKTGIPAQRGQQKTPTTTIPRWDDSGGG